MKFYVTDRDYKNESDGMGSLEEAAAYALDHLLIGALDKALVVGMESETFSTTVPAHVLLILTAGPELENSPWFTGPTNDV